MGSVPRAPLATIADLLARSPDERLELIRGTLIEKPRASSEHALAQTAAGGVLRGPFQRRPGGRFPGGWWFFTELSVQLGPEVVRPDICAYRRERMPQPVSAVIVDLVPDWVCELLSPSNEARDRVEKMRIYFRSGISHYWLMNPVEHVLEVYRRTDLAYALVLTGQRGDRVRAEPFDAVELSVDELFGDDPEEPAP